MKEIGENIRTLRDALELTQEQLSERGKIANRALQRAESGLGNPRMSTLNGIAEGLGIPFSVLFDPPEDLVVRRTPTGLIFAFNDDSLRPPSDVSVIQNYKDETTKRRNAEKRQHAERETVEGGGANYQPDRSPDERLGFISYSSEVHEKKPSKFDRIFEELGSLRSEVRSLSAFEAIPQHLQNLLKTATPEQIDSLFHSLQGPSQSELKEAARLADEILKDDSASSQRPKKRSTT